MATRIGFVGGGAVASRHAESLGQVGDVRIVAVTEPREEPRAAFVSRTGALPYSSLEAMLETEELDAVYICVPPDAHGLPEEAALERGLPFFVEEPLSSRADVADRIATEVSERNVTTATGYRWRYLRAVDDTARLLAEHPPVLVTGHWLDRARSTDDEHGEAPARSGGQLIEQATHLFDLARLLVGEFEVTHVQESEFPSPAGRSVHQAATCALRFESGAVGTLASSRLLRRGDRVGMEFVCDGMVVELTEQEVTVDDGQSRQTIVWHDDPFLREDADFIAAVRGGPNRIRAPYGEALRSHQLTLAAAEAARTRGPSRD